MGYTDKKRIRILAYLCLLSVALNAQSSHKPPDMVTQQNKTYRITMSKNREYAEKYAEYAMEQMRRYGIPASVTLAQGILESASGQSELSRKGNNHFGIKATKGWIQDGGKYLIYTDDKPNEKFCQYASVGDSYEHHSRFLRENSRYAKCFQLSPDDYKGWTTTIANAGYASNAGYAKSLQSLIEKNNLQKYDQMVMAEMRAQGRQFGTATNPRSTTGSEVQANTTNQPIATKKEEKQYFFPLRRDEFMLITSPFGMRKDPMDRSRQQMHKGIDIQTKHEAVLATEDRGKVVAVNHNTNTGGGKSVTVEYDREDGSKYQCVYMHLDSINVKVGDTVNAGQQLGISGNTGTRTTGEHLHFGVKSISADGTKRDIDPAAYLAEIAQRGNLQQKALYKGNDLIAKYKVENPINTDAGNTINTNTATNIDANMSPDDWMKKLLSSEDSGVSMSNGDPVIDMAIQLFTSLMMLAVQIDNKNEDEKMEAATDAAVNKVINISSLVPTMKSCTIAVSENGMATLTMNNGQQQFSHVLTNAETSRLSQALNDSGLSQESKQQRVAAIINSIVISQQVSQNYNQAIENQETEQLMRR